MWMFLFRSLFGAVAFVCRVFGHDTGYAKHVGPGSKPHTALMGTPAKIIISIFRPLARLFPARASSR